MSAFIDCDFIARAPRRAFRPASPAGLVLAVLLLVFSVLLPLPAAAQCSGGRTTGPTVVYDRPPSFSTGAGWQYGSEIARLPSNSAISVCETASVGLFVDKKKWLRIDLGGGRSGWIFAGTTTLADARAPSWLRFDLSPIPSAVAADGNAGAGLPGFSDRKMILIALLCVLLGMFGKLVFDEAEANAAFSWQQCLQPRKFIKAFVAAPIALVAFLNLGNFAFTSEVAVVVSWCMAFQNGFFWQTLLPAAKMSVNANAGAAS